MDQSQSSPGADFERYAITVAAFVRLRHDLHHAQAARRNRFVMNPNFPGMGSKPCRPTDRRGVSSERWQSMARAGEVPVDNSRRSRLTPYTAPNEPLSLEVSTHDATHHTFAPCCALIAQP